MIRIIYTILLMCFTLTVAAGSNSQYTAGNDAYRNADYHKAIQLYHQALKSGPASEIYYNLANSYYRTDNIPKAILYYEKAAKLNPLNSDIRHNIEIANNKTPDKLIYDTDSVIVLWYQYILSLMTVNGWAYTAIIALGAALVCFLLYLFLSNIYIRRLSFYISSVLLILFIFCNIFAWQRKEHITKSTDIIVMKEVTTIKSSPTYNAGNVCQIHEGSKLHITDNDIKDWFGIRLPDGREGWITRKDVAEI